MAVRGANPPERKEDSRGGIPGTRDAFDQEPAFASVQGDCFGMHDVFPSAERKHAEPHRAGSRQDKGPAMAGLVDAVVGFRQDARTPAGGGHPPETAPPARGEDQGIVWTPRDPLQAGGVAQDLCFGPPDVDLFELALGSESQLLAIR